MSRGRRLAGGLVAALLAAAAGRVAAQAPTRPPPRPPTVTSLTLFAGTRDGLWRSRNWGGNWERVEGMGAEARAPARCIVPVGPWVYVGGDRGLYVSEDWGDTWHRTYAASPVLWVLASRYPMADPTIFLGTREGLLKSDDLGRTVTPTALKGTAVLRIEWPGPALVAATTDGLRVSEDAGEHFWAPEAGLPEGDVRSLALSSFYIIDPVLFAGVGTQGVFHSSDGARTWSPSGLPGRTADDLYWLGPFLFALTDAGLYRSEDVGKTWTPIGEGLGKAQPGRVVFPLAPENGAEMFVATDRGVYWSGDGGFHFQPSGLEGQQVIAIATFPARLITQHKKGQKK